MASHLGYAGSQCEDNASVLCEMNPPNNKELEVGPVFLIGVSGGTASGKTSVCNRIINDLGDTRVSVISMDSFYKTLPKNADPSSYNFDHPDAFDYDVFSDCLSRLVHGKPCNIPVYSFEKHSRLDETETVVPTPVVIVEGILIFHDERLRNLMHMKVFVDTDADTRLLRRIKRDIKERGRTYESVLHQYEKTVKPSYDEYIAPTKRYADIIIPHWPNEAAVDMITQHVRAKMGLSDLRRQMTNLYLMPANATSRFLHTIIRDATSSRTDFVFYADRLIRLLVEYGTSMLPFKDKTVTTPMGEHYPGVSMHLDKLCAVSMVRGGEAMETALAQVCKDVRVGKLLFRYPPSVGENAKPTASYVKLPKDLADRHVFLLDPVIGRGMGISAAVELLKSRGVEERKIVILSLMASPDSIKYLCRKFPSIRFVTTEIDAGVNDMGYLVPGVGNFADRYFGTENLTFAGDLVNLRLDSKDDNLPHVHDSTVHLNVCTASPALGRTNLSMLSAGGDESRMNKDGQFKEFPPVDDLEGHI
eukprot:GDKJ01031719.1.p1 GENE.GDKJ01031719.1~~GDKJ01031719.1.p1  ORF type:complete len:532 (-),score=128.16 GDKJ01031719.1:260-1855(-)